MHLLVCVSPCVHVCTSMHVCVRHPCMQLYGVIIDKGFSLHENMKGRFQEKQSCKANALPVTAHSTIDGAIRGGDQERAQASCCAECADQCPRSKHQFEQHLERSLLPQSHLSCAMKHHPFFG